jgi:hypothetical protein
MRYPQWLVFALGFSAAAAFGAKSPGGSDVVPVDAAAPNSTKNDNGSTAGKVNSEAGKAGAKSRDTPSGSGGAGSSSSGKASAKAAIIAEKVKAAMWAKLRVGQTKAEVAALLGEPNIKSAAKWFYSGAGWVMFDDQGVSTGFGA